MSNLNRNHLRPALTQYSTILLLLGFAAILAVCVQPSYAQQSGYGSINGVVTDTTGAVVSGANVTITNVDTGVAKVTVTGSAGDYAEPYLPPGRYSVAVSRSGFKTTTQPGVVLTASQVVGVNITLSVGQAQETVQVSSAPEMIETASAELGQTVNNTSITELPLDTRNPAAFANLSPGGVDGTQRGEPLTANSTRNGIPTEEGTSIDSSRMGGVFYMLDGVINMDTQFDSGAEFPNSDSTQEFRVIQNNFSAEYGGGSTAVVSVVTKSGTNNWHGDAFEFDRNQIFNAPDWFSKVKDGYKRDIFGGGEGGPIQKNKQFIFGNFQLTRGSTTQNGSPEYVPLTAMINNGDFSSIPVQLHDYDGTPFVNNQIPTSRFDQVSLNVMKHVPTAASNPIYVPGVPIKDRFNEFTFRYDWDPSAKDHIMGRVFLNKASDPEISDDSNWPACSVAWADQIWNYAANWTHTFKPTLINSFSFGYDKLANPNTSCIDQSWQQLGANIPEADPVATILVSWGSTGFGWSDQNTGLHAHDFDFADQVSWTKGKNLIVAGVNVMSQYNLEQASWLADPFVDFNGTVTGAFFSDFLLGDIGEFMEGGGEYNKDAATNTVAFVEDTIKLKPNLTLDLGVRYEPFNPPSPNPAGREADWVPGQQSTVYPNAPEGLVFPGDAGVPAAGISSEYDRVSPRIGLTWQPKFLPNTSIRAAGGRFAIPVFHAYYNHISADPPFSPTFTLTPTTLPGVTTPTRIPFENPWSVFQPTGGVAPFPPFAYKTGAWNKSPSDTFILPTSLSCIWTPQFKMSWAQDWNLSIQHQFANNLLITVAYVGSEAYHITIGADRNPGIYASGGQRTLYPNFGQIIAYEPWGTASYEGLQITAEKRFSHGFQFTSNYAWSKSLDESSESDVSNATYVRDGLDAGLDHGISGLNVPYIWSNYGVWKLPQFKNHGPLAAWAIGNWEVSGIFRMDAGSPFSIQGGNGDNNSKSDAGFDLADLTGKPLNAHSGSKLSGGACGTGWLNCYFNRAAFEQNAPGTFGDSPRNYLRGPRNTQLDTAFLKNFPFYQEQYNFQFRWEMYNATNTPYFGLPDNNPTDSNFGQIGGTTGYTPYRVMQFALKFLW